MFAKRKTKGQMVEIFALSLSKLCLFNMVYKFVSVSGLFCTIHQCKLLYSGPCDGETRSYLVQAFTPLGSAGS